MRIIKIKKPPKKLYETLRYFVVNSNYHLTG